MKNFVGQKQIALKSQDIVVAAKLAVAIDRNRLTFARLGAELFMSASEVHGAVQRAMISNLVAREYGELTVNRSSLMELLIHGVRYVFPAVFGPIVRGVPTGISTSPLMQHFERSDALPIVWPHASGEVRGLSLVPLCPSVPSASLVDPKLHQMLALIDALRGGAARERELASQELPRLFS